MRAIRIEQPGGPEVLRLEEIEMPRPMPGRVLIKVAVAGVNFADLGLRQGISFGALAPLGRMVTFGNAGGRPLPLGELKMPMAVQGLSLIGFGGPWLRPGRAVAAWEAMVGDVAAGRLRTVVGHSFPLADAADAHRALAGRETIGKVVLVV